MSVRRTTAALAAGIAFAALAVVPADAAPVQPARTAAASCEGEAGEGLCPIPALGITESSAERPPDSSVEHGGGTLVDAFAPGGPITKSVNTIPQGGKLVPLTDAHGKTVVGIHKHDDILGLSNKKGTDAEKLFYDPDALIAFLAKRKAGDKVTFRVWSNHLARGYNATVTLGKATP